MLFICIVLFICFFVHNFLFVCSAQVPGSRTKTAAQWRLQGELVMVDLEAVRRICEHCPYSDGAVLVLQLRDPAV